MKNLKMKKSLSVILSFIMILSVLQIAEINLFATDRVFTSIDGNWEYTNTNALKLTKYLGDAEELEIPYLIDGYPVYSIGENTFYDKRIKSVTIPSSCVHLNDYAFNNCSFLKTVNIGSRLEGISYLSFYSCEALEKININTSNKNYSSIDGVLFNKNQTELLYYPAGRQAIEYTVPNNVEKISANAFNGSTYLKNILFNEKVTRIEPYTFLNCKSLSNVVIPDSITHICNNAFENCTSLKSITISKSVSYIGKDIFLGCSSLKDVTIFLNNSCDYTNIKNIVSSVIIKEETIPASTFKDYTSLRNVTLSDDVTTIGGNAFSGCALLENVTIGNNVSKIYGDAFSNCQSLTNIVVNSKNKYYTTINGVLFNKDKTKLVCYPTGKNATKYTIPNSVKTIGESAFSYNYNLKTILLPESTNIIEMGAFSNCTALSNIILPDNITKIGSGAFSGCISLTNIIIPNNIQEIPFHAFYNCKSLKSITIGSAVNTISDYSFTGCTSLKEICVYYNSNCDYSKIKQQITSIIIPDGIKAIYESEFNGYSSLSSVSISDSVERIGKNAFSNTPIYNDSRNWENGILYIDNYLIKADTKTSGTINIKNGTRLVAASAFENCKISDITIPNSVNYIGIYAFSGCTELKNIIIPNSVKRIDYYAFYNCKNLKTVKLSNNITEINHNTFNNCISLTEITIPDSVTTINTQAFYGCTLLSKVNIGKGVKRIGTNSFFNCTSLKSLTIPGNVTDISDKSIGFREYPDDKIDITTKVSGFKIYGYEGTAAERYANYFDIPFYSLGTYNPEPENNISFPDVNKGDWYYDVVKYVAEKGFITGYQNGKFGPNDSLKRQDFVCILARIAGADLSKYENKTSKLKDVQKGAYYAPAVNWAVEKGYVSGYKNGKFGVNDPITREQICVIMINYINKETDYFAGINGDGRGSDEIIDDFKDGYKVSPWAVESVGLAIDSGIISGMSDGRIAPTENASRAQIAAIIQRMDTQGMFDK